MCEFILGEHPFIALCDLLKVMDFCDSGAIAKHVIADGFVKVDGEVELRKRAKIVKGQTVEYQGQKVKVV